MIPIAVELDNLTKPAALREDEYLGEDSLVYCSKCRTARQKRIAFAGKMIEPRCMCACQTAAYEQQGRSENIGSSWTGLKRIAA